MLEMRVQASVVREMNPRDDNNALRAEALTWARLFERRYIDRTIIGILIMFFQRACGVSLVRIESVDFAMQNGVALMRSYIMAQL
jgi:hypothetical protein